MTEYLSNPTIPMALAAVGTALVLWLKRERRRVLRTRSEERSLAWQYKASQGVIFAAQLLCLIWVAALVARSPMNIAIDGVVGAVVLIAAWQTFREAGEERA